MDVGSDDESGEDDGGDGGDEAERFLVGDLGVWFGRLRDLIFELEFKVSDFAIAFESIDLIHDLFEIELIVCLF